MRLSAFLLFIHQQKSCSIYMHCHVHSKLSTFLHVRWHFNNIIKNYGRSIGIWKKERNWYGIERMLWVCWYKSITMILKTIILFSVAPTRIVPCSDKLTNCDEYPPDLCTNELYRLWREDNCRKFCGICSGIRHVTVRAMKH